MAKERTSVRMQAQIKTLSEQAHSIRSIARILTLSRRTVRKFLRERGTLLPSWNYYNSDIEYEIVTDDIPLKRQRPEP